MRRLTSRVVLIFMVTAIQVTIAQSTLISTTGSGEWISAQNHVDVNAEDSFHSATPQIEAVQESWSFAIITDLHIGSEADYRPLDYGNPGWNDDSSGWEVYPGGFPSAGKTYKATCYLRDIVDVINLMKTNYSVKFVVVLGDLTDSAETSELEKAREILGELQVPWIPVIGNHDVWPYVSANNEAPEDESDKIFNDVFDAQYEILQNTASFDNWTPAPKPVDNPETGHLSYLQNFAFDCNDYHFVCLDFNSRKEAIIGGGVRPDGELHSFPGGSWNWFTDHLEAYCNAHPNLGENIVLFAHHPFNKGVLTYSGFSETELDIMHSFLGDYSERIWGEFAGHTHQNKVSNWFDNIMHVIETDANFKAPSARIVQIGRDSIDYSLQLTASSWLVDVILYGEAMVHLGDILFETEALFEPGPLNIGHAGIVTEPNRIIEARRNSGVISSGWNDWFPPRENVYVLRVQCSDEAKEAAISFAEAQIGKRYDWNWWQKDADPDSDSWYCGELVWAAYYNQGIDLEDTPDSSAIIPYEIFIDDDVFTIFGTTTDKGKTSSVNLIASCPVDLSLTDPDNLIITKDEHTIPEALYIEDDLNGDGSPDDMIAISKWKTGKYRIIVSSEPAANTSDTYDLEIRSTNTTLTLAKNLAVGHIPLQPYVIESSDTDFMQTATFNAVYTDNDYPIVICSNSMLTKFTFNQSLAQISFEVSGEEATLGYCNVIIPKTLLRGNPWTVNIGNEMWVYTTSENDTHSYIHFTYTHASTLQVEITGTWIIPESSSFLILPLFMTLSILAAVFTKKKVLKKTRI